MRPARTLAAVVLSMCFGHALADEVRDQIRALCASEWPKDYQMQKYCIGQQTEGAVAVATLLGQYRKGTEEWNIVARCFGEWKHTHGFDYTMVKYCSDQQLDAYRALYK